MKKHVAVYLENESLFPQLENAAASSAFTIIKDPKVTPDLKDFYVVCDIASYKKKKLGSAGIDKSLLYVISAESDEENLRLVEQEGLMHLVGLNEHVFATELMNHFKKSSDQKIWGLHNLLDKKAEVRIISLSDSKFTDELIVDVLKHFDFKDYFTSPAEYLRVMANELVSNSLYKGPNKRRSEQGLDPNDRKSPVHLKGSDLVQVTLGMDERGVALSVQDSFGGLDYSTLIASLKRSFEEKTVMEKKDGAGLGLYITFLHSNQFIVNHRSNFRTEVICVIDKNKRYKNYKQRIRSFHYFQEVSGEKTNNK